MQAHFNDPQSYSHHLNGKVQSDRIFPGKSLRRSCVKFPTKKSAYHRKCAFPTIRRIDTPKAAGDARNPPTESAPDPKIGRRFPRRFRQTPTYPAALCVSRMTRPVSLQEKATCISHQNAREGARDVSPRAIRAHPHQKSRPRPAAAKASPPSGLILFGERQKASAKHQGSAIARNRLTKEISSASY